MIQKIPYSLLYETGFFRLLHDDFVFEIFGIHNTFHYQVLFRGGKWNLSDSA